MSRHLERIGAGSLNQDEEPGQGEALAGALWALAELGAQEAAPEILVMLGSVHDDVRLAAFDALRKLRLKSELPAALKVLSDPQAYVDSDLPVRPEGRGRVRGRVDFQGSLAGASTAQSSVFVPDLVADLGGQEYVPDLVRLLPWLPASDRLGTAAALCRLGSREGARIVLRSAEWGDGSALFTLNALRKPELWSRLAAARCPTIRAKRKGEVWAEMAAPLGLRVELPRLAWWGWNERVTDSDTVCDSSYAAGLEAEGSILAVLSRLAGELYSFILEDDRLRVVRNEEALAFWRGWNREAAKPKEK